MQNKLEERFDEKIKERNFNVFEITGFRVQPILALKVGMAMGYLLASDDFEKVIKCK